MKNTYRWAMLLLVIALGVISWEMYEQVSLNKALRKNIAVLQENCYADSIRLAHHEKLQDSIRQLLAQYAYPEFKASSLVFLMENIFKVHLKKKDSLLRVNEKLRKHIDKQQSENQELVSLEKKLQQEITVHKNTKDSTINAIKHKEELLLTQLDSLKQLLANTKLDTATLLSPKGVSFLFLGKLVDGKPSGFGVGFYEKKGYYIGEWVGNARSGKGKHFHKNGDIYEGEFENDLRSGYGIYYYASGEVYKGQWKNDLMNGEGEIIIENKTKKGNWLDGKLIEQQVK
ncbi:MAG: hypothetical protein NZ521_10330 [Flammeovirgaceae bacterium]|nr:hypothetical protein [Flammeovirgaceae bacterium]MDW8288620.1 hypothetical protein [Flammeovirgaceae bacterium]